MTLHFLHLNSKTGVKRHKTPLPLSISETAKMIKIHNVADETWLGTEWSEEAQSWRPVSTRRCEQLIADRDRAAKGLPRPRSTEESVPQAEGPGEEPPQWHKKKH